MHISAGEFIKQNRLSFFSRLKFPAVDFSDTRILREKKAFLIMTKNQVPFEKNLKVKKILKVC